jgi:hypothetical protein
MMRTAQANQLPHVLGVELAAVIVGDHPYRADGFPVYVKRNEQALFGHRHRGAQIGVTPLPVTEQ